MGLDASVVVHLGGSGSPALHAVAALAVAPFQVAAAAVFVSFFQDGSPEDSLLELEIIGTAVHTAVAVVSIIGQRPNNRQFRGIVVGPFRIPGVSFLFFNVVKDNFPLFASHGVL